MEWICLFYLININDGVLQYYFTFIFCTWNYWKNNWRNWLLVKCHFQLRTKYIKAWKIERVTLIINLDCSVQFSFKIRNKLYFRRKSLSLLTLVIFSQFLDDLFNLKLSNTQAFIMNKRGYTFLMLITRWRKNKMNK